jgi:hypothetical protein
LAQLLFSCLGRQLKLNLQVCFRIAVAHEMVAACQQRARVTKVLASVWNNACVDRMKNELEMVLLSRKSLTDSVARQQITALSDFGDDLLQPDKCSEVDPIRTPLIQRTLASQLSGWSRRAASSFTRAVALVHASGQMWNLGRGPDFRFRQPLFTNYWTAQFDGRWASKVGIDKIEEFVLEMFRLTGSDFGLLTTEVDLRAKNTAPPVVSFMGFDPEQGVPGLLDQPLQPRIRQMARASAALKRTRSSGRVTGRGSETQIL